MNTLTRCCGQHAATREAVGFTSRYPVRLAVRLFVCATLTASALPVYAEVATEPADKAATAMDAGEVQMLRQELARQDALLQKLMSQQSDLLSRQGLRAGEVPVPPPPPGGSVPALSGAAATPAAGAPGSQAHPEALPLNAATVTPPPAPAAEPSVSVAVSGGVTGQSGAGTPPPAGVAPPTAPAASAPSASSTPAAQPETPSLADDNARRAYASGVSLAYEMQQSLAVQKSLGITLSPEVLMAGLQDALSNHPLRMQDSDIQSTLASLNADFTSRMQSRRADEVARGREFRSDFRRKKGVVSDAGSLYLIESRGTGRLRTTDMATLLVTGRLPDGTVFDGSGEAGQARKVKVGAMLPAIAIGLQKVGAGGHLTVVVPPEKGYGDMGLPPTVPGGATLIFDITVKGVNDAG
ncbi:MULTISPECIES: FKBP-type peptidyl-prolyl cis-trans isomerase [Citrobacter]|uniref:FKBP-type peptidyl-prolyl cis-trans isomerase n=1 Tax=Citrobacter TaxID=544 RepID=UPI0011F00E35|nr:FKBP-type peptidyl-prolyl cis-trans isomerase [Citrobacter braakii]